MKDNQIETMEFNVFAYKDKQSELVDVLLMFFNSLDVIDSLEVDVNKLRAFLEKIRTRYTPLFFHNFMHAVDVTHSLFLFLKKGGVSQYLTPLEIFSLLVGSIAHDAGHLGVSNKFLVKTGNELSKKYGEDSVLEKYAIEILVGLLEDPKNNLFKDVSVGRLDEIIQDLNEVILATDMANHFAILTEFNQQKRHFKSKQTILKTTQRKLVMKMTIKCADLSNVLKSPKVTNEWAQRIAEEMYCQGDKERELKLQVSPNMDRYAGSISVLQLTFMDVVVRPLFRNFIEIVPHPNGLFDYFEQNYEYWRKLVEAG